MTNWKVGDQAIIYHPNPHPNKAKYVGLRCTILRLDTDCVGPKLRYSIHVPGHPAKDERGWGIQPKYLRPIPKHQELSSWDECAWRPKDLEVPRVDST